MSYKMKKCSCGKNYRVPRALKNGKMGCYNCWRRDQTIIYPIVGKPIISLDDALKKTYEIRGYVYQGKPHVVVHFPTILANKKIKITLVDDDEE